MSKRIKLNFMVDPQDLIKKAYIPDPVYILITDPEAIFITGILGESGRKLVLSGAKFIFTKKIAEKLIKNGVARRVNEQQNLNNYAIQRQTERMRQGY